MNGYSDIIGLPHHTSAARPRMSQRDRAAQFSPFAALTGYEDVIAESARLTDERRELSEDDRARINRRLQIVLENICERPGVKITYFVADRRKSGGAYETAEGFAKHFDEGERTLIFTDNKAVPIDDIYAVEGEIFRGVEN